MSGQEHTGAAAPDDGGLASALALAGARGGDPGHGLLPGEAHLVAVPVSGPRQWWGGALDVEGLALGSSRLAAAALARLMGRPGALGLRSERVAAAFDSFGLLRVGGEPVRGFAPLSRFWPCADGWLRTHANYPHHRVRLERALGLAEGAGPERVGAALARLTSTEAEHRVIEHGGVAAAVRSRSAWEASAAGIEASHFARSPLRMAPSAPDGRAGAEPWRPHDRHARAPLSGLRVLDLSRVIAGPTATRTLAALGADVLRLDPPALPELREHVFDSDTGKRRASADLRAEAGRIHALLAEAHVVVTGYRPGSLEALGFGPTDLAARHPHLAVASLSAWGPGPWGGRRGFDSIVQAAGGIAHAYRDAHGRPGALPVQALDHATGQLLVAGLASVLWARLEPASERRPGGVVSAALAHTAEALWALGAPRQGLARGATPAAPTPAAPTPVAWRPEPGGPEVLAAPAALDLDGTPAAPSTWSLQPATLRWNSGLAADTVSAPTVDA